MGRVVDPKVSVIVPMYNVEEYAGKCLDSALNQTYSNTEIIIVDDGSTDHTTEICKAYEKENRNIVYIRQENGGLSSARNRGIRSATGDYVLFLDGDDLLRRDAIKVAVDCAVVHRADLVAFGLKNIDETECFGVEDIPKWEPMTSEQMLRKLFLLKGETGSACGKLYHRRLSYLLVFPEGQLFEDFGVIASVVAAANEIYCSSTSLYGYVSRQGSITRVEEYTDAHVSGMIASVLKVENVASNYPALASEVRCFRFFCILRLLGRLDLDSVTKKYGDVLHLREIRKEALRVATSSGISIPWRLRCVLFSVSPSIYKMAYALLKR